VRRQIRMAAQISSALEMLESGIFKYKLDLSRRDLFGRLSQSIDRIAELLAEKEKRVLALEMDNEVLVNNMRETQSIKERFHRLFDNPNYGILLCDFSGRIMDVNMTCCRLLGYTKEELMNLQIYDLYAPEELTRSINAYKIGTRQRAIRYESQFITKSRRVMDVEISSNIYDFENEIIQNIISDISQRKQVESELKSSEEQFRTFMESARDLMFITDAYEKIVYANPAMVHTLEYSLEDLKSMTLSDLVVQSPGESIKKSVDIHEGESLKEVVWKSKSAAKRSGELVISVILNQDGQLIGLRGIFRDTTDRKKISESRRLAQLGRLMADVAHEVKNRLTAIIGIVEYIHMERGNDSEIVQDMLMIHEECMTMDDFVRRMLSFSKPSDGDYKTMNVHSVLDSVMKLISKSLKRNQVQVQKSYDSSVPMVKIDEKKMSEVFMNLIQNAQEAMKPGGLMEISTEYDRGRVRVDIRDHGVGITEENLEKIFDPFFTTKENGTGLGVSACYGIVQAHGGELSYTSKIGSGTTAHVVLPVAPSEESS
jgi:PAS domain S-box-containing protein